MRMTVQQRVSLEHFLEEPEEKPYREYLYGRVVPKAMPKLAHSMTQLELGRHLGNWAAETGHGLVVTEQRCILRLPEEVHVQLPDVAWFSRGPENDNGSTLTPPDLAVEILSPDDRYGVVQQKIKVYLQAGTRVVWVVDPEVRTVSICRRGQEPVLLEGDATLDEPVMPGFRLSLRDLFRPLDSLSES